MTEDEAKTKWCPFARVGSGVSGLGSMNRDGHQPDEEAGPVTPFTFCIGSACMAWRVVREEVSGTDADGFGYVRSAVTGGYCGLAGAPQ